MTEIIAAARSGGSGCIWLSVWEHNPRAIAFYRKYAFEVAGEHVFQVGTDPLFTNYPIRGFQSDLTIAADAATTVRAIDAAISSASGADDRRKAMEEKKAAVAESMAATVEKQKTG